MKSRLVHARTLLMLAVSLVTFSCRFLFAGELQWVEVRSPHFSVITDAGDKRGREVAMRFEQMRAVFGALMVKANVNLPVPLQIVAFRNTKEMRQVAPLFNGKPTEVSGIFQPGDDRSFIMLDMSVENPWTVVFHEYAHQLMNGNLKGNYAPWFEEGFAEYFSTIEVDGKEARVGKIPADEYAILRQTGMMKISDLFQVRQNSKTYNESGDHRTTFYAESGMLMHYLYDSQLLAKTGTYFDLVDRRVPIQDAILKAFGMSAQQFDKALSNYVMAGRYKYYPIATPASISSNDYSIRSVSVLDSKAVLADIHLHSPDYRERAVSEFEEILKSDPKNAAACRGLGYAYLQKRSFIQAADYFNRASLLDSKDPRVHYYNALLMAQESGFGPGIDVPTMTRELETSINLDPNFADSYALLAFTQSTAGDPAKALATMGKALAIRPRDENYLFNLANIYVANRRLEKAIAVLESLRGTDNPELASRTATLLAQLTHMAEMTKEDGEEAEGPTPVRPEEVQPEKVRPEEGESSELPPASADPVHAGPTQFLKGTLIKIDCGSPPSAILTVVSGSMTWKMKVRDPSQLVLIGADTFSCSWNKRKVAINYYETAEGEANVISLELQGTN
ncbi:MAG: tetratricopeptide repeat protein [Candidatus Sulfotelmatobacter sp.]